MRGKAAKLLRFMSNGDRRALKVLKKDFKSTPNHREGWGTSYEYMEWKKKRERGVQT